MPDDSLYVVTGVHRHGIELRPVAGGAGGAAFLVEELLLEEGEPDEGDVLRLIVDGLDALGDRVGTSGIAQLTQTGQRWEAPGRVRVDQVRLPGHDQLTTREMGWLQKATFRLFDAPALEATGLVGCFDDAAEFLQERLARAAEQEERQQAARAKQQRLDQRAYDAHRFVNPYNFVPLPVVAASRAEPVGHLRRQPGLLSGTVEVELEAVTPLLLRQQAGQQRTIVPRRDGTPMVPASSVKGAVRSLVETITGSCLRSFDPDFVPGYRDVLHVDAKEGWQLAVVEQVDNGRPTSLQVCDEVCWVAWEVLRAALPPSKARTGARLQLDTEPQYNNTNRRKELRAPGSVTADPGGEWVLLVTHTGARRPHRTHLFAVGRLTERRVGPVTEGAWSDYLAAVDGADGLELKPQSLQDLYENVSSPVVQASRLRPTDRFLPGYVLWVRVAGDRVSGLSLSHTWRHRGEHPAGDERRLNGGFLPCGDEPALCPACRMFGASPAPRRGDDTRPLPYRGHVRFTDLLGVASAVVVQEQLAPMGPPRPGSGNFYLRDTVPQPAPRAGQPALAEWGSARDGPPRQLRGRKYYWHTTPRPKAPRYQAHGSHRGVKNAGNMQSRAELVQTGSRFTGQIVVENLEPAQLGALLVALDPSLLPGEQDGPRCWHVGGGRPLGLGSVCCVRIEVRVDEGAGRYSAEASPAGADQQQAWIDALVAASSQAVQDTWPSLVRLLTLDAVNPNMVSYPRAGPWPNEEGGDEQALWKPGLRWWSQARGVEMTNTEYCVLPEPLAADVSLPIDPPERGGR